MSDAIGTCACFARQIPSGRLRDIRRITDQQLRLLANDKVLDVA